MELVCDSKPSHYSTFAGYSMLSYNPLDHLHYLGSHGIIPCVIPSSLPIFSEKKRRLALDSSSLVLWWFQFWVVLHFSHLVEDRKLLKQQSDRHRAGEEKNEMEQRWDSFWSEVVLSLGYGTVCMSADCFRYLFFLAGRWKRGCEVQSFTFMFSLDADVAVQVWMGVFGLISAAASFRTSKKATALAPSSRVKEEITETSSEYDHNVV